MAVDASMRATSRFEKTEQNGLTLNLLYSLPYDEYKKSGLLKRGFGLADGSFDTVMNDYMASFCVFNGALTIGDTRHCFLDLGLFETVSEQQWSGRESIKIQTNINQTKQVAGQERASWTIAGFNPAMGERVLVGHSHGSHDSVLTVQTRLNMIMDLARRIAQPYEPEIRQNYRNRTVSPKDGDQDMVDELREIWDEFNPHWEW
ncbi:hypothetical protein [Tateyamaria sp. syn59]|uniref:hypothetical protein n=1 Tax=Tateyamaria sp. syn59 TaxID=2576942 RepID=UPI0011BF3023|nr:hypothetical protein [Tateyamaria sp. syn59]